MEPSPDLNLLLSPTAVRYARANPLDQAKFVYLEGCIRTEAQFDMPVLPNNDGPLVYVSFGSLGAIDTVLMTDIVKGADIGMAQA